MLLDKYHQIWIPNNGNSCLKNPAINSQLRNRTQPDNKLDNIENKIVWDESR
ncbi:MAG: hypothetical protein O4806_21945 [Trichodesmium sp. St5_bin8]|nr:hypothetical protein [Trichodesmium sp. St5_bin8]